MASFAFYRPVHISKIISGGQTGADRAALDWAIANNIPHGGWCPKGRLAEDGIIEPKYKLNETPGTEYIQRTEWNVRDSDATVIVSIAPALPGGSLATKDLATAHQKPCLHLSGAQSQLENTGNLRKFIREHNIRTLNVAGPRNSGEPEVGVMVAAILEGAL